MFLIISDQTVLWLCCLISPVLGPLPVHSHRVRLTSQARSVIGLHCDVKCNTTPRTDPCQEICGLSGTRLGRTVWSGVVWTRARVFTRLRRQQVGLLTATMEGEGMLCHGQLRLIWADAVEGGFQGASNRRQLWPRLHMSAGGSN